MSPASNTSTTANNPHVIIIFGSTGPIGTELARILSVEHLDWKIRAVTRDLTQTSRLASLQLPNVTMVQGDPMNVDSVTQLCLDCSLIFSCIGFHKYEAAYWAKHWPIVARNLLQQVTTTTTTENNKPPPQRRRLVVCDNLYAYGAGLDSPITVDTPTVPESVTVGLSGKPNVRSWMHGEFQRHMEQNPGTLSVVGGSDFFGPFVTKTSILGDTITGKLAQNQTALAIGSVQPIHDFCFAPDFARALATVAVDDAAYNRFWICPHSIHGKSLQTIANDIDAKIHSHDGKSNKSNVRFSMLTKPFLYLLSPFMTFAKEMIEMYPFWTQDYCVDDSEFCQTFHVQATNYDDALQALVDFYKGRNGVVKAT